MAWVHYNPNPVQTSGGVGDCAVRAIAKALDITWEQFKMREKLDYEKLHLPICKKCGATVPPGKTLCWCCEHTPKLHIPEEQSCDSKDACEIKLEVAK